MWEFMECLFLLNFLLTRNLDKDWFSNTVFKFKIFYSQKISYHDFIKNYTIFKIRYKL